MAAFAWNLLWGGSPTILETIDKCADDPDELLNRILGEAKKARVTQGGIGTERARRLLRVFRAKTLAMNRCEPGPCQAPITLFRAEKRADLRGNGAGGWDEMADGNLWIRGIPGDHYSILREHNVKTLAEE